MVKMDSNHSYDAKSNRKHSISALFSTAVVDPRLLIPKNLYKSQKNATDDERLAMLDRFTLEGIDGKKLNDSKKLPHVWRWLVDAEINCHSLRHQLDKIRIQHEQEIKEIENYVEHLWNSSIQRLTGLRQENRFLKIKLMSNSRSDSNNNYQLENEFSNLDFVNNRHSSKPNESFEANEDKGDCMADQLIPKKCSESTVDSILKLSVNCVIINDKKSLRHSLSCPADLQLFDSNRNCKYCHNLNLNFEQLRNRFIQIRRQLDKAEEENCVLKKFNEYVERENDSFKFKLSKCETLNKELEQRLEHLEEELSNCKSKQNASHMLLMTIDEQRYLIKDLNNKIKILQENLDCKRMDLEELEKGNHHTNKIKFKDDDGFEEILF